MREPTNTSRSTRMALFELQHLPNSREWHRLRLMRGGGLSGGRDKLGRVHSWPSYSALGRNGSSRIAATGHSSLVTVAAKPASG